MANDPLLQMQHVTAGYMEDIDVLQDVSLAVETGRISGLIGLNGAGKSTLFKALFGFLRPRAGSVLLNGEDITTAASYTRIDRGMWYIPQESSLFPYLTVKENLCLPLQTRRSERTRDLPRRLDECLQQFPTLAGMLGSQAGDLSGGQQKLLEFAKAYLVRPTLCLIDEPSIGLSPKLALETFGWIRKFAALGMAILVVDHNVRRVIGMADTVYVLSLGQITASGRAADFKGDLHRQVKEWLGISF